MTTPNVQPASFDLLPTERTLCQQIGRGWAMRIAGAATVADRLTFVEDASSAAGNIYAPASGGMPVRAHRRSPGISITPREGLLPDGASPVRDIGVSIECRAATSARCVACLNQIYRWMLPGERTLVLKPGTSMYLRQDVSRIVGFPAAGVAMDTFADLWAIVHVEPLQPIANVLSGHPGNATEEGEAMSNVAMLVRAHPVRIWGPVAAFTAHYAGVGGFTQLDRGTITVSATHLTITSNDPTGTTQIAIAGKQILEVVNAINAVPNWIATPSTGNLNAIPGTELNAMATVTAALGAGVVVTRLPGT